MTSLASDRGSVGPELHHTVFELALVDVFVTAGAVQLLPVINEILRLKLGRLLVAIGARYCDMPPGQYKARLLVLREGEG